MQYDEMNPLEARYSGPVRWWRLRWRARARGLHGGEADGWPGLLGSVGEVCVMMLRNRGGRGVGGLGEARSLGRDLSI